MAALWPGSDNSNHSYCRCSVPPDNPTDCESAMALVATVFNAQLMSGLPSARSSTKAGASTKTAYLLAVIAQAETSRTVR